MQKSKNKYQLPLKKKNVILPRKKLPPHPKEMKYAVDFLLPIGAPVLAAASGKVVWLKNNSRVGGKNKKRYWNLGNRVVIRHRFGEYTAYEHFKYKGIVVKVGQNIKQGQLIGYSGNTGWSTIGPHLHFEVFTNPSKDESEGETISFSFEK